MLIILDINDSIARAFGAVEPKGSGASINGVNAL